MIPNLEALWKDVKFTFHILYLIVSSVPALLWTRALNKVVSAPARATRQNVDYLWELDWNIFH